MAEELEGFGTADTNNVSGYKPIKKKKQKMKGGGFQAMGLSFSVLKGIQKRGYKIPTPIQRKTIPIVLGGRDVVAMARTGSGKTACFLIPLFEKLINSLRTQGARALILSPTRELALQTLKFIKDIGKFTDLKSILVLGGDSMDNQFAALHGNPDIIVATPGRLLHVCVEMNLKLNNVQYVVFDEADRLFEMGFGEQLHELLNRLPDTCQTLLFSATLPKVLVDFTKAGLNDPALLRLDLETKIPETLKLAFLCCCTEDKVAALLYLLKYIIPFNSQTLVFAATKHHVEYIHSILDKADISNACIYSTLDSSARKINAAKFQYRKVAVLVVTDVAARGLDIPQLDFVINFNFPAKSKLFVHRVGRCARAGREGTAYSLVNCDEFPYMLDLHLFLGRPLQIEENSDTLGSIPPRILEGEQGELLNWHESKSDLNLLKQTCTKGYKAYLRSRPGASMESVRRAKKLGLSQLKPHPLFQSLAVSNESRDVLLKKIKGYRPNELIFALGKSVRSREYFAMETTILRHRDSIANFKRKQEENSSLLDTGFKSCNPGTNQAESGSACIAKTGHESKRKKKETGDSEYFIPYQPKDHYTEQGLSVNTFQLEASKFQLDLTADSREAMLQNKNQMRWDRKKKKMAHVNEDSKVGKIRTESGVWIPATYRTDRYAQWKVKNRVDENEEDDDDDDDDDDDANNNTLSQEKKAFVKKKFPNTHWGRHNEKLQNKIKSEIRRPEEVLKLRKEREKLQKKKRKKNRKKHKRRN